MDIKELRNSIDNIDRDIAVLFDKRMNISREIAEVKAKEKLNITDSSREKELIENNLSYISSDGNKRYYTEFEKNVIKISKKVQKEAMASNSVFVNAGDGYLIHYGLNCIQEIKNYGNYGKTLIIHDCKTPKEIIETVSNELKKYGEIFSFEIQCGEYNKSLDTLNDILSYMLEHSFTRLDRVVAVGGGIVGDIGGLCSSLYMRGIDFYNVPTTLLAQVDSSIGGKTAVNFGEVKNIIGTFYQPKAVFVDESFLTTLDKRQFSNGVAEIIKIFAISSMESFYSLSSQITEKDILSAIELKKEIVEKDIFENGLRRVLNFGHTVGHAIELSSNLLHGECVGLGMLIMSEGKAYDEIKYKLSSFGLPTEFNLADGFSRDAFIDIICDKLNHDKKADENGVNCIICKEIGEYEQIKLTYAEIKERIKKSGIIK